MKYIVMCGGTYPGWGTPRQFLRINNEAIIERTIRLLRENGVEDIAISSNHPKFEEMGVPVLKHENDYVGYEYNKGEGLWCNCFYPTDEPTCYLFGDVIYSPQAIETIVEAETDDILFFGSRPPFWKGYPKPWIEPFAFKVTDTDHLKSAISKVRALDAQGAFNRRPIAWELWSIITGHDPNEINYDYIAINDYTCDVDYPEEIERISRFIT